MKCLVLSLLLSLTCPAVCFAQGASYGSCHDSSAAQRYQLYAHVDDGQSQVSKPPSRWRAIGRGLARAAQATAVFSAATAGQALRAYSQYSAYSSGYGSTYADGSCSHGYTAETCPYGYNGNSYGSSYLSGDSSVRTRPDGYGNYRYYMSDGRSGHITPSYAGGYRLTTDSGESITASASSLRSMGYQVPYGSSW